MDMTIGQVAKVTGYAPESLRNLAKQGRLPGAYRFGRNWLINREKFQKHRDGDAARQADPARREIASGQ